MVSYNIEKKQLQYFYVVQTQCGITQQLTSIYNTTLYLRTRLMTNIIALNVAKPFLVV